MLCKTELTCGHLVVQPKNPSKKLKLVNKAMYSHWENAEKKVDKCLFPSAKKNWCFAIAQFNSPQIFGLNTDHGTISN